MTEQELAANSTRRSRRFFAPRFSLRSLAILVTLVCAYFGAWEVTKRYGVKNPTMTGQIGSPRVNGPTTFTMGEDDSPMPLVVRRLEYVETSVVYSNGGIPGVVHWPVRRYYLWLFGPMIKLPFEAHLR